MIFYQRKSSNKNRFHCVKSDSNNLLIFLTLFFSCFLLQAILFYVPRWLWKNWEAGKVAALRMDLNLGIISEVEKKLKKKLLIEYMYSNLKHHNFWAYRYFFCELLALINVGGKYIRVQENPLKMSKTPIFRGFSWHPWVSQNFLNIFFIC